MAKHLGKWGNNMENPKNNGRKAKWADKVRERQETEELNNQ